MDVVPQVFIGEGTMLRHPMEDLENLPTLGLKITLGIEGVTLRNSK
jgi:hypothetical protein